jgi:hypothetical protein
VNSSVTALATSLLLGLLVNEATAWSPQVARWLVRMAARRRYSTPTARIREEELLAFLNDRPGHLMQLFAALWLLLSSPSLMRPRKARVHTNRRGADIFGWAALLVCAPVRRLRHSVWLAERLVRCAVARLPKPYREHYQSIWAGELDRLKAKRRPLLGWAVRLLLTSGRTGVELRQRLTRETGRVRGLPRSPVGRAIGRARHYGFGALTAAGVFCSAAAGWSSGPDSPTRAQLVWALLAALLTGAVVTWQVWPRGPAPPEHNQADPPDRPDG